MFLRLQLFPVLVLLGAGGVVGCAVLPGLATIREHAEQGQGHLVQGVPFVAQDAYQCGPAALAMVLGYYGRSADPDAIAQALYLPSVRGALNLELELYARRRGLRALSFSGSIARLKTEIARDHPLVVFQDLGGPGLPIPHFAVLVGYDDVAGVVVLHSGTTAYRVLSYAEFERTWAARGRWTLLVTPEEA
jgi:ABC-type bacteriocin/lantibiotic exporter with double-glycine peptidase domain